MELPMKVGSRDVMDYGLVSLPQPTTQQLKIREGWLKR
jgi:hypothetical protein